MQVISAKEGETTPPSPYAWLAPGVEIMISDGKSGLREVVVTGLARPYCSMGGNQ